MNSYRPTNDDMKVCRDRNVKGISRKARIRSRKESAQ